MKNPNKPLENRIKERLGKDALYFQKYLSHRDTTRIKKEVFVQIVSICYEEVQKADIDQIKYAQDEVDRIQHNTVVKADKYEKLYHEEHLRFNQLKERYDKLLKDTSKRPVGRPVKFGEDYVQDVKRRKQNGWSNQKIAGHYHMSLSTVKRILKK